MSTDERDIPVEACFTPRELVSELDRYIVGQNDGFGFPKCVFYLLFDRIMYFGSPNNNFICFE